MQSSRDAPLSSTATEPALVCQGALSSRPSGSQPENHVAPEDVDWKLERRPDSHAGEENDTPWGTGLGLQDDGELSAEEIQFLEEFPGWEKEQEKAIAKLHALADDADSTHQKFTKANVVACSISVISGVASVLGLALTPLTAGGSLILTSASQGVGLTASVINTVAELMEKSYTNNSRTQSSQLVSPCDGTFQEDTGEQTASYVRASGDIVYKCGSTFQVIRKHIRALRLAKAHPHLVPAARALGCTQNGVLHSCLSPPLPSVFTPLWVTPIHPFCPHLCSLLSHIGPQGKPSECPSSNPNALTFLCQTTWP